jgi:hypothetical protein
MDPRTDAEFEQQAQLYIRDARELLDLGVDVVRLRNYANGDIPATWLLQAFAKREKVSRLTKVERAYNLLKQVRPKTYGMEITLTPRAVVEIFLTLQDLGCGFLVKCPRDSRELLVAAQDVVSLRNDATHDIPGGYDHFLWSASLATVGRVATSPIHMGALDRVEAMATGNRAHSAGRQDQALHLTSSAPAHQLVESIDPSRPGVLLPLMPKAQKVGSIPYHFWVRPDSPVTFSLPSNLTPQEAKRLASFIRSVPFSGVSV